MTDKQPAQPLVGFEGEQRVVLVNHVLDFGGLFFLSGQLSHLGQNLFTVLDLEKAYNYESFADFLKKVDAHLLIKATQIALCCDVPLVPILHEETSQYHKGIPRGKIRTIVDRIPEPIREEVLAITIKMIETSKFVQELHKIDFNSTSSLDELRSLQATWNPKWSDSRISTLISPFLSYISNEIADREQSHAEIQSRLENVSVPAINKPHPDFDPSSMPENLEACYANYTKCHDAASAPEAQKSLQKWYNNWTGGFMDTMLPPIGSSFLDHDPKSSQNHW
ncbi:hypothetical protein M408DRAFT_31200, partial [Serendipita vermifera MAFF 305830]